MRRTKPPFRADHVGSLLRPAALKEARERRARGEISPEALTAVEDRAIEDVIRKQEAVGLKSVTDGEFRRASWNYDFLERLQGVESYAGARLRGRVGRGLAASKLARASNTYPLPLRFARDLPRKRGRE